MAFGKQKGGLRFLDYLGRVAPHCVLKEGHNVSSFPARTEEEQGTAQRPKVTGGRGGGCQCSVQLVVSELYLKADKLS